MDDIRMDEAPKLPAQRPRFAAARRRGAGWCCFRTRGAALALPPTQGGCETCQSGGPAALRDGKPTAMQESRVVFVTAALWVGLVCLAANAGDVHAQEMPSALIARIEGRQSPDRQGLDG